MPRSCAWPRRSACVARHVRAELVRIGRGPAGAPLRWGYTAVSEVLIAGANAVARLRKRPSRKVADLTVIAKTFERPANARRMASTLRRVFDGPVIVADDSRHPQSFDDPGISVVVLPFDTGVAAGRNAALAEVSTEFVLSVDDDFVFTPDLDLNRVVDYLRRNPEVDIVGGRVVNLPLWQSPNYSTAPLFAYRGEPVRPADTVIDGLPVLYKVPQFFVARTDRIRLVRWDDRLKRVDHNDFFTRAYGTLLTVFDRQFTCLHAQPKFNATYQAFRRDVAADLSYLGQKWM
jgi:glycosyltransferase involved in cell wall biosynthesis